MADENSGEELEHLRKTVKSIQALVNAFDLYRGENSRCDLLLQNLDMIMHKFPSKTETSSTEAPLLPSSPVSPVPVPVPRSNKRKLKSSSSSDAEVDEEERATKQLRGDSDNVPPQIVIEAERAENEREFSTMISDPAVFTTELVILKILRNLTDEELITCRRVNSNFNNFATEILHRRENFQIKLKYDWRRKKYIKPSKCNLNGAAAEARHSYNFDFFTLTSLTQFMKTCPNFPCKSFAFYSGTLCAGDLQEFLSSHGTTIKRILVDLYCPPSVVPNAQGENQAPNDNDFPSIYFLRKLLVDQLPNLEWLYLCNAPKVWDTSLHRLFPEPKGKEIYLPNLKSVTLALPENILEDILKAGVNLQALDRCVNIVPLLKANKFYILKTFGWLPTPVEIRLCENFLPITVSQLTSFYLSLGRASKDPNLWPKISNVITNILEASSQTLTQLSLGSSLGFLSHLKFPALPKIYGMNIGLPAMRHFSHTSQYIQKIFPPLFQFTSAFPNLSFINFDLHHLNKVEEWENYWDNGFEPVLTVKTVSFHQNMVLPLGWLSKFSVLFPNVETIVISTKLFTLIDAAASGLWSFGKLKHLRCEVNLSLPENTYPVLDCAFTGFSAETVLSLQQSSHTVELAAVEGFREHPSIASIKEIKTLRLTLVDESQEIRTNCQSLITHVTGIFAFQMCPSLRVFLEYRVSKLENLKMLKNALSSLYPYVHSGHS